MHSVPTQPVLQTFANSYCCVISAEIITGLLVPFLSASAALAMVDINTTFCFSRQSLLCNIATMLAATVPLMAPLIFKSFYLTVDSFTNSLYDGPINV